MPLGWVMTSKKIYRSRENRMICGVAAGIGTYFGIDPTVVRVVWVLAVLLGVFPAVLAYAACCFIIPEEPIYP
jgi:phage shock protein PspC (stress-responsive transcriptional regulator)